jgi:hypothetical protein
VNEQKNEIGGYKRIYQDLLKDLSKADISSSAEKLGLVRNKTNEIEIPFMGQKFLVSNNGVKRADGKRFIESIGSVLIHYIMKACDEKAGGQFVTFAALAGPGFSEGSYSSSALENPLIKRFQGKVPELLSAAKGAGGRPGGDAGLGGISLIFDLLPHIPIQLVFYDRDDEFSARVILLFDSNATSFLEFEFLAVLATIFVRQLCRLPA